MFVSCYQVIELVVWYGCALSILPETFDNGAASRNQVREIISDSETVAHQDCKMAIAVVTMAIAVLSIGIVRSFDLVVIFAFTVFSCEQRTAFVWIAGQSRTEHLSKISKQT